jgi:phage terminase small subunit
MYWGLPLRIGVFMEITKVISPSIPDDPDWMSGIDAWDEDRFLASAKKFLLAKNKVVDASDVQLLAMLSTQIGLYVNSIIAINREGAVIAFNKGVTLGPNPHISIADKALNRVLQLMKELELTPRSKEGFKSNVEFTDEFLSFMAGPKAVKKIRERIDV